MPASRMSDQTLLREQAYVDDRHLDVRYRTHQRFTRHPVDFVQWTIGRLLLRGDERVLDVGCGPGDLLHRLAAGSGRWRGLVGLDLSRGMVSQARARVTPVGQFLVADAQALPFADGAFDVVVAGHMLYHVPDIPCAVAEAARVLAAGGRFLATTNSQHTMPEYFALRDQATARFPAVMGREQATHRFSLENGAAFLQPHFTTVQVHRLPGTLRFPEAQPLVDYFASARALHMHPGHTETEWLAVLEFVRSRVQQVIDRDGHFDVSKVTGALVGTRAAR